MRLIINADDLGISAAANEAAFALMAKGLVTSGTILANGPTFADAVRRAREFPRCSFGVHLNGAEFGPLTRSADLAPILDAGGRFRQDVIRHIGVQAALREALLAEWIAQVQRVRAAGIEVTHVDSHQHMHTSARLFPVLKALQRRAGIRKVRRAANLYLPGHPGRRTIVWKRQLWSAALRHWHHTVTTDGFTDLWTFYHIARSRTLRHPTFELMVHPGAPECAEETALLEEGWWRELRFPVTPISYRELT